MFKTAYYTLQRDALFYFAVHVLAFLRWQICGSHTPIKCNT